MWARLLVERERGTDSRSIKGELVWLLGFESPVPNTTSALHAVNLESV
jgi:hypothetical protein